MSRMKKSILTWLVAFVGIFVSHAQISSEGDNVLLQHIYDKLVQTFGYGPEGCIQFYRSQAVASHELQRFWPDTELAASLLRTDYDTGPEYRITIVGPSIFGFDGKALKLTPTGFLGVNGSRKREVKEKDDSLREEFSQEKFDRLLSVLPKFKEWSAKLTASGESADAEKLLQKGPGVADSSYYFVWKKGKAYLGLVNEHMMNGPPKIEAVYSTDDIDKIDFVANQLQDMKTTVSGYVEKQNRDANDAKERVDRLLN